MNTTTSVLAAAARHRLRTRHARQGLAATLVALGLVFAATASAAETPTSEPPAGAVPAQAAAVNVNSADAPLLAARLSGIGLARARAIVAFREANGPFETLESLVAVAGVSPAIVERNRALIRLED